MSEKSFAICSIGVAVVWGTFFYPPPPTNAVTVAAPALVKVAPRVNDKIAFFDLSATRTSSPVTPRPQVGTPTVKGWGHGMVAAGQ